MACERSVPFFNYNKVFASQEEKYVEIFRRVLRSGAFIMQSDLARFETSLATWLGVKHAIGLANCTDALHIAFRSAGVGSGDEVIFPAYHGRITGGSALCRRDPPTVSPLS